MNPLTTLARIRAYHPCADGWAKLLKHLGPDLDTPISLGDIAISNGAADAIWCVRALDWGDVAVRRAVIGGALLPAVERASAHTQNARVHEVVRLLRLWTDDGEMDLAAVRKLAYADAHAAAAACAYAYAADAVERDRQRAEIIAAFPPVRLA